MTPKRTRLKGEERRQLILEAARRVFLEGGFAGARTRRIAEEAGITEALLYRFFPSKLAIYEAAVLQPLEEFVARMLAATGEIEASSDDREDGLRRINEMLFHFMRESAPFLAVVLLSELNEGRRFYQNDFHPEGRQLAHLRRHVGRAHGSGHRRPAAQRPARRGRPRRAADGAVLRRHARRGPAGPGLVPGPPRGVGGVPRKKRSGGQGGQEADPGGRFLAPGPGPVSPVHRGRLPAPVK